jgi:hypothetical protein
MCCELLLYGSFSSPFIVSLLTPIYQMICFCHLCSHKTLILLWLSHLIHQFEKDKHCIPTLLFRCCITIQFSHLNWINWTKKLISSLCEQFVTEAMVERELALSEQVLAEKYKDRLQGSYRVIYLLTLISTICSHQLMSIVFK